MLLHGVPGSDECLQSFPLRQDSHTIHGALHHELTYISELMITWQSDVLGFDTAE